MKVGYLSSISKMDRGILLMAEERRTFAELDDSTKIFLEHIYGAQKGMNRLTANTIQYIRELNNREESFLGARASVNMSGAVLQTLYKIKGKILPLKFNMAVNKMMAAEEAFRLNYCPLKNRTVAVVFTERRELPSIVFRNLEDVPEDELDGTLRKIMETEMRQEFDLKHDLLIRFVILRTGTDEYAVIVTAVQAVLNDLNIHNLFRLAQGENVQPAAHKDNGFVLTEKMAEPVMNYWSKVLNNLPPLPKVPYMRKGGEKTDSRQKSYVVRIPLDIQSDLRKQAKDNKMMLMSILHSAWSFLLQQENACQDVAYCLLVPRNQGDGAEPSLVPMRMQMEGSSTVQGIITKAFQQFVISKSYAALARRDIAALVGSWEDNFDHFLNFVDFFQSGKKYVEVRGQLEGSIVLQNTMDVRNVRLALRFSTDEGQVWLKIVYNDKLFTDSNIRMLANHYLLVLQQLLTDWNLPYVEFLPRLQNRWEKEIHQIPPEDSRKVLQHYISRLSLLQECDRGLIQLFMRDAKLSTRFEGDRIAEKEIEENAVFLVKGKVARCLETGDGWYNALDIRRETSWINELALLPDRKCHLSAEVLTEQVVLLTVPLSALQRLTEASPRLAQNIIQHTVRQLESYQKLWMQS